MVSLAGIKSTLLGVILAVVYSDMVVNIVMIRQSELNYHTYPPAVIALLVMSILQMIYILWVFIRSGQGAACRAKVVLGLFVLFAAWDFGAIVATTVLRHHRPYCHASALSPGNVCGVLRGVEGLGWALFGLDLIYIVFLAMLVAGEGTWDSELIDMPRRLRPNEELEKAPAPAH